MQSTVSQQTVDVCILGGGLGGLISAIAVRRVLPDASIKVFERFPEYKKAGALVGLGPNAQAAVEAIDPALHAMIMAGVITEGRAIVGNEKGETLMDTTIGAMVGGGAGGQEAIVRRFGRQFVRWGWWELHLALVAALPQDAIVFDRCFVDYEERDDGVAVQLANGDGNTAIINASVVIGADGGFSAVRRRCVNDGPPQSPGTVIWRARVPPELVKDTLADGVVERDWAGGRLIANIWRVNAETGEAGWSACAHQSRLEALGVKNEADPSIRTGQQVLPIGKSAHERVVRVFSDYPAPFLDLLKATDPLSVAEHGVYSRQVEGRWGAGRVTLVGDAAHPIRPVTGQGFAQAAEDAVALAHALRDGGLTPAALRAYEDSRMHRVAHIARTEWDLGEAGYKPESKDRDAALAAIEQRQQYEQFLFGHKFKPL